MKLSITYFLFALLFVLSCKSKQKVQSPKNNLDETVKQVAKPVEAVKVLPNYYITPEQRKIGLNLFLVEIAEQANTDLLNNTTCVELLDLFPPEVTKEITKQSTTKKKEIEAGCLLLVKAFKTVVTACNPNLIKYAQNHEFTNEKVALMGPATITEDFYAVNKPNLKPLIAEVVEVNIEQGNLNSRFYSFFTNMDLGEGGNVSLTNNISNFYFSKLQEKMKQKEFDIRRNPKLATRKEVQELFTIK